MVSGETSNTVTGLPPDLRWEKNGNNIVLIGRVQLEAEARAYQVVVVSENLGGQTTSEIVITITGSTPPPDEDTRGITIFNEKITLIQGQGVNQRVFSNTVPIAESLRSSDWSGAGQARHLQSQHGERGCVCHGLIRNRGRSA